MLGISLMTLKEPLDINMCWVCYLHSQESLLVEVEDTVLKVVHLR